MSLPTRRSSLLLAALLGIVSTAVPTPSAAQESDEIDGSAERLDEPTTLDPTLFVDVDGELFYRDPLAPAEVDIDEPPTDEPETDEPGTDEPETDEPGTDEPGTDEAEQPSVGWPEFALASLPGAAKTIVLDFDGHATTGTSWNAADGPEVITTGPYDLDGDPTTWSSTERQVIRQTWSVVAEDFAPWNVNVTTTEPTDPGDLTNHGDGDARWGARVVITPDDWSACHCGALAYLGAFDDPADEPAFVHDIDPRAVAQAASHAIGHLLGLDHDGRVDDGHGDHTHRYEGHESLDGPHWAPIMGAPSGQAISQWSAQEYHGADNVDQDDLEVISSLTNGNGFGLRPDDHGGPDDPTPLNGPNPTVDGIIGTRSDTDAFGFTTTGGRVALAAGGDPANSNLDAGLTLLDDDGNVVATADPADRLTAQIEVELAAGTYTAVVDGVGVGLPFLDPPTGYSDRASLGRYNLTGTIEGGPEPDLDRPEAPVGLIGVAVDGMVVLGWAGNDEDDLAGYVVERSTMPGGPYVDWATIRGDRNGHEDPAPPAGVGHYVVVAVDAVGNRSERSNEVEIEVPAEIEADSRPSETEGPEVTAEVVATSETEPERETFVYGDVVGDVAAIAEPDGRGQRLTETLSGGAERARHDRLDHRWTIPAAGGNQQLRVVAEADHDAGDADDGFVIEWSLDRTEWTPLVELRPGEAIDDAFDIGAPEGTVHVRVTDTDRTPRQQRPDSVLIDLLRILGDGLPPGPEPDPTEAMATIRYHYQGRGEGERAVVVTASVRDDRGDPVKRATVEVVVGGDIEETLTITTDSKGVGSAQTDGAVLEPEVEVCLAAVDADGLAWQPRPGDCPAPDDSPADDAEPEDGSLVEELGGIG